MFGRSNGSLRSEKLGQNPKAKLKKVCFTTLLILGILILIAKYKVDDPLFHQSSNKITNFLTSENITDNDEYEITSTDCDKDKPIDCKDPEVFHLMMRATIDYFKDLHFYKFGKPVVGSNGSTCDMAWRYRSKEGNDDAFNKDYRRFVIMRFQNCSLSVLSIGDYHTGLNARKRKKNTLPISDTLPIVQSEASFIRGKYLIYTGGGDRCKNMNHYLSSFLCALGEAQYLNRTLIMDLTLCLSSIYSSSNQDEEGKDFRFYFDFEHLKKSASVLDVGQFWLEWNKLENKHGLNIHLVEDFKITPMKLLKVKDALIMRKFGYVEPNNYWYKVCEGDAQAIIRRPWHFLRKSRRVMDIVSEIASRLKLDFDSVHIVKGKNVKNKEIISTLLEKIEKGRNLYIATNEADKSIFEPLKEKYSIHFLEDYEDLWDENNESYAETTKLNNGVPVEFDGYMRLSVDSEVFAKGKKQIQT